MPEDIAQLAERLSRLEAERDVLATLYAYAHSIDYGDEEGWVDCFTDDGAFDIRSRVGHYGSRRVVGRDALGEFISSHTRAPELWHKHMIVEPVIRIDGDTATASTYLFVLMDHDNRPLVRVFGRYRDRLRRCDDGRWRFEERIAEIESMHAGLPPFVGGRPSAAPPPND